ncbi:hypothetical protein MMC17_005076 [Xylographa soralifera]|nr:hypothetical protein [Xylographa soralifera]
MTVRHSTITEAHARTCEWIFEDGDHQAAEIGSRPRTTFMEWLKSDNGIYWICGKAGSGKSTLMKFLCENDRTMSALKLWAGSDRLITASYFFWNAGVPMQKSQPDLLQSLLHEVLGKFQNLIPLVCAQRLMRIKDFQYSHLEPWSRSDLLAAFQQLMHHELASTKFCFFVDGLDEYDGDHEEIIHILKDFANSPHIKVCASSRPWNVFVDAFGQKFERKLLLEDLTREDIRCYVRDLLDEHEKFVHLNVVDNRYSDLDKEIVDKAQGVFLWVFLVVRSLRKGFKEADDILDLQRRLRLLPADLETYFQHMLDSIEECYQEQSAQIFLIAASARQPLSIITYSILDMRAPGFAQNAEIKPFDRGQINTLQEKTRRRINARCKDWLEIHAGLTDEPSKLVVDFIHRTARDFLKTKDINDVLRSQISDDFDPRIFLCEAFLVQIKAIDLDDRPNGLSRWMVIYAREIETFDGVLVVELLDELDRVMTVHGTNTGRRWVYHPHPQTPLIEWDIVDTTTTEVNFLEFAAQACLALYVAQKLDSQPRSIQRQHIASRLLNTVFLTSDAYHLADKTVFDMVCILLERGAKPNDRIDEIHNTAWTNLLYARARDTNDDIDGEMRTYLYKIIEQLILHGADPNVKVLLEGGKKEAVSKMLHRTLSHAQVEQLEKLMAQRRQPRLLQWLGWR